MIRSRETYKNRIMITDALTGELLINIPNEAFSSQTKSNIIEDILLNDLVEQHGFIVKYGIEP